MRRNKNGKIRDDSLNAQMVAFLIGRKKMEQQAIAKLLNISQPMVSRLKSQALDRGWLTTPNCKLTNAETRAVQKRLFPEAEQVTARLAKIAKETPNNPLEIDDIRIFDSGKKAVSPDEYDQRLAAFADAAVGRLTELVPRMSYAGVTWGNTVACLVDRFGRVDPTARRSRRPITFVPLSGVLVNDPNIRLSSTTLVARLHEATNGVANGALSLGAVPARIPAMIGGDRHSITSDEQRIIRQFVEGMVGYSTVFGRPSESRSDTDPYSKSSRNEPLISRIDSLITSVGCNYSRSNDPWFQEMIDTEQITAKELDDLTVGDIGGVFLEKTRLKQFYKGKVSEINGRWLGAKLQHYAECARRAKSNGMPGVILVAVEPGKSDVVEECVRRELVNQLIIDRDLGSKLAGVV